MPTPFDQLASLNRLVHEPARLAILTALSACEKADFIFLLNVTGLTKGNLSSHLMKLERGRLVQIRKEFEDRHPITYVQLTPEGREALEEHWQRLEGVRRAAKRWRPVRTA
jgi:DNA-binding transcriptional ArsR family regulator